MSQLSRTDLSLYLAATMASSFSDTNIGGAVTTTPVAGSRVGEIFFPMGAEEAGGSDRVQHQKVFLTNDSAAAALYGGVLFIENGLLPVSTAGVVTVTPTSASDGSTIDVVATGMNDGTPVQEKIQLTGATARNGYLTFTELYRVEMRNHTTGALISRGANGDIAVAVGGVALGRIPGPVVDPATSEVLVRGAYSATSEVSMWLESSMGGTTTNGTGNTCATAPAGSTFTAPADPDLGLSIANSGVLLPDESQAIWLRLTLAAGSQASSDIEVWLGVYGGTTDASEFAS